MNPLLDFSGLPRFADFKPAQVAPAVDQLLEENRALIARLAAEPAAPVWDNFVGPLEDANERLHRAWGQVGHLNAVMNSPELREAYNAVLPKITQYYTELGQHAGLYSKFKALRAAKQVPLGGAGSTFAALSPAQQKIIDNEVRDIRLGGAELPAASQRAAPCGGTSRANERLHRAWGQTGHLNAVMNSPELREAYNAVLPKITQYSTEIGQHEGLYRKFKALRAGDGFTALSAAQRKIIDNEVRDFRLGGAELPPAGKKRYTEISDRLSMLESRFSDNLLDATNAWSYLVTDAAELAGLPDDAREAAREAAASEIASEKQDGWKFTLHAPSYMPVLQYADNSALRERLYRAYVTRASEFGDAKLDNTALITEIVNLRREIAQLLGFDNFAEYSLEAKMADTPAQVLEFLRELAVRAKPYAQRDLKELQDFARKELAMTALSAWDYAYVSEKLRVAQYAFSENEVKQYFPETTVLPGMFKVVETLYGLSIAPTEAPQWHDDVRFFSIRDRSGALVGQFYLDLYARPSKRGGAWMDDAITRRRTAQGTQAPVAYLNCNFTPPVPGKPALFTHDEVITLFHEFGHGLHHLLTRVDYLGVSGINGVEWDAVELPSTGATSNMSSSHGRGWITK